MASDSITCRRPELRGVRRPGLASDSSCAVRREVPHRGHPERQPAARCRRDDHQDHPDLLVHRFTGPQLEEQRDHHREERDHQPEDQCEEHDVGPGNGSRAQRSRPSVENTTIRAPTAPRSPRCRRSSPWKPPPRGVAEVLRVERGEQRERVQGDVESGPRARSRPPGPAGQGDRHEHQQHQEADDRGRVERGPQTTSARAAETRGVSIAASDIPCCSARWTRTNIIVATSDRHGDAPSTGRRRIRCRSG